MFQAALVAAVAVLLVQVSDAKVDQKTVAERADELRQLYLRDVEDKSSSQSSKARDEARKQKVCEEGFFPTVFEDVKYVVITPLKWLLNTVLFPFHFLQNAYYAYSLPKEEKAAE